MKCSRPVIMSNQTVGCGQCVSCRVNKRRQWTGKLLAELQSHPEGSCVFVTLTYDDKHVPLTPDDQPTLEPRAAQLFVKRLRRDLPLVGEFRFFLCGEYGDRTERPHYHLAGFGLHLSPDNLSSSKSRARCPNGRDNPTEGCLRPGHAGQGPIARRPTVLSSIDPRVDWLTERWGHGFVTVSEMTPARASYIAGYCVKKLTKPDDVRLGLRHPEFSRMSRRPALGDAFIAKLGDWLTTKAGSRYVVQNGDVPQSFTVYGKSYPLSPRHQRMLRTRIGLPEKRSEVKMYDPGRWLPPELPTAEELLQRRVKETQYGETQKRRASARRI